MLSASRWVSFDFGLTTVTGCFLIWLETVRDQPFPTFAHVDKVFAFLFAEIQGGYAAGVFDKKTDDGEFAFSSRQNAYSQFPSAETVVETVAFRSE